MTAQLFLLVSWGICWYFFLFHFAKGPHSPARYSRPFARTTYAVFALLCVWSSLMWIFPPQEISVELALLSVGYVVLGQALMCAARRALPLTNKDVVLGIATAHVSTGPYRFMPHPMYVGLLLALLGSSLLLFNMWALYVWGAIVVAVIVRAIVESRS